MGAHLIVLSKSYPMNNNMAGFVFKNLSVLLRQVASALDGLI